MIGKTIGKYRFVEELRRDGTSVVYKAVDETLEREVAVKVLNPELTDSEVMKHFQAEATTLARLHHPDIAGIHEIHRTESDLLLVMEMVRGETLEQLATRLGPLPPERAAYLVAQVLGALQYAHGAGVVHRDLRPTNVMVTDQGGVKVMDFGLARVTGEDQLTADGFTLASPAYMAPERLSGKEIDGRADVYSAGVIFYRLLTGHVPFEAPTPLEMVQKQLVSNPTPAIAYRPDLPGWCQAILDRALVQSPVERFPTAEAFRATLLAAISEATESTGAYAVPQNEAASMDDGATLAAVIPAPAPVPPPSHDPLTVASFKPPIAGAAVVPPVAAPKAAAGRASPASVGTTLVLKRNQFALVGVVLLVLVVGVILLAVAALRRPAQIVIAPSDPATVASSSDAAPAAAAVETPPATAPPVEIDPPPVVLPPSAPPPSTPPPSTPPPSTPPSSTPPPSTPPKPAASRAPALAAAPSIEPPSTSVPTARLLTNTPYTFDARAVVADGDKRRERDAVVLVADGAVTVKDKNDKVKALYVVPIDTVVGLTYSKSNQPLWNSPSGPAEAMRVEGGAFGFLKGGERNWFGLRTKDSLLVLRVDDDQVAHVAAGLEQRTGLTLERLVAPKYHSRVYKLTFMDGALPRAHQLREGETVIGRAPTCDLVITAALMSRHHARVRVAGKHVFLRDAGSTYGTTFKGVKITSEQELIPGDSFTLGPVTLTLDREVHESEVLSEGHEIFEESGTLVKRMDQLNLPPVVAAVGSAATAVVAPPPTSKVGAGAPTATLQPPAAASTPAAIAPPTSRAVTTPTSERRSGPDRRKADLGRPGGERRSGRDRRGGRLLRLLTEISKTLVTMQPLEKVLARVVELVFEILPAERAFLLLRDAIDQPLSARVMRNRDGSVPAKVSISRTIVNTVMRDRVAMLAKDALYDTRLHASDSIQSMNVRSFMCAPLWNQNEVIGVLYCDNPRSKKFITDDLEVFAALCNYAAVAIEQARLSLRLLDETKRRERLTRYHSPGVINRIMQDADSEGAFVAQERDVSVMFCDIVGFTAMCEHAEPQAIGDMLNDFFGRMGEVIFEHDGTLDKFIGDAILAVFGAPFEQPDHATKAVAAALAMQRELAKANAERPDRPIRMRIAINSGRALTGDIGSPKRREFTVLGDVVNTASRIESTVAKPDQIVISKNTLDKIGNVFEVRSLGGVKLRGRDTELEVFEVLS